MAIMIAAQQLSRTFGPIKAVDGVSFSVSRGEVLGFLGPNGAGKSTTMKMLTCFLTPSSGTAKVGGYDIIEQSREVRKVLGYLPENAPLYGEMEVGEFLRFVAEVRELPLNERNAAVDRVIAMTSLGAVVRQRIETLSKGYKRRVGLAQALVHDPAILILDEPTDGLDPNQKHEVRELINSMAKEKCIILSTHILEEVDAVCTRAVIISKGKVVADATPEELKRRSASHGAVSITFSEQPSAETVAGLRALTGVREVASHRIAGSRVTYVLRPQPGTNVLPRVVEEVERWKWPVTDVRLEMGQLDEVFREITR
ncbi:MAG: ATP-binding cassette domain-containing protein [Bdellovibrionales bacterium]|nr:ATP-binding cassette domain-containing protein [Bdellovibrionales bacterium]